MAIFHPKPFEICAYCHLNHNVKDCLHRIYGIPEKETK